MASANANALRRESGAEARFSWESLRLKADDGASRIPPVADVFAPVADTLSPVTPIFAAVQDVFTAIPPVLEAVEKASIVATVPAVFAVIEDVFPPIPHVFSPIASAFSPIPYVLQAVTEAGMPRARCLRPGDAGGAEDENASGECSKHHISHCLSPVRQRRYHTLTCTTPAPAGR